MSASLVGSEMCIRDRRKGVAISRLAEVLLVVFEQLESEKYKVLLEETVYARMLEVIKKLKPACAILNGGRLA
eukprot:5387594-Alexandrium_andersonii.AAC.1